VCVIGHDDEGMDGELALVAGLKAHFIQGLMPGPGV
jgi:hypothetical protein